MDQRYEHRAEYLKALAHPVRLQILDLLRGGDMSVWHIVVALKRQQAYVSGQLRNLHGSRLVECHRKGIEVYYRLANPLMVDLLSLMFGPVKKKRAQSVPLTPSATLDEGSRPMLNVKIIGAGCSHCKRLEAETRAALDAEGMVYELKVADAADIVSYGVMSIPALIINEKVVSCGRIPPRSRITERAKEFEVTAD